MSFKELIDKLVVVIKLGKYDVIICNYLNGDMVGYIGVYEVVVKVCEVVDECIGCVVEVIKEVDG